MSRDEKNRLIQQLFKAILTNSAPPVPVLAYTLLLAMDIPLEQALWVVVKLLPANMFVVGLLVPYLIVRNVVDQTFAQLPGDTVESRLIRVLECPRRIELRLFFLYLASGLFFIGAPTLYYGRSPWWILLGVSGYLTVILLMFVRQGLKLERLLRPEAIKLFHQHPKVQLKRSGPFWRRQSSYLPYLFALFVLCTVVELGLVLFRTFRDGFATLLRELEGMPEIAHKLQESIESTATATLVPLILVGGFVMGVAGWAAYLLARNQREGARAVQDTIEALAAGRPMLPNWVATDELGDLAVATAGVFEQLKGISLSLRDSADRLGSSAEKLSQSSLSQSEMMTLQASALQETQVTAQEIKQTSIVASQKAETVLSHTERVSRIGEEGEAAIEQTLASLHQIREQVMEMASRVKEVEGRARQIGNVTTTVKDLADQSNMLALNAAIEAVRAGEHGKGFGVVAREIRSLADQSIKSTEHVRDILQEVTTAIRSAVTITEQGAAKVDSSVEQVRLFGDSIRQMAAILRENASSVRQISAAVSQQNTGIGEIFKAVENLNRMTNETVGRLHTADEIALLVKEAASQVTLLVRQFDSERSKS